MRRGSVLGLLCQFLCEFSIQLGGVGEHRLYVQTLFAVEVVLGDLYYHAAESQDTDEVGDRHEGVEHIVEAPYEIAGGYRTDHDEKYEDHAEYGACDLFLALEEVFCGFLTVVRPCENGGESKEGENDGIGDLTEDAKVFGEGKGGDDRLGEIDVICDIGEIVCTRLEAGGENGECGEGTDNEGIEEHLKHAPEPLLYRLSRVGSGVGDNGGAETCFVGEDTSCKN